MGLFGKGIDTERLEISLSGKKYRYLLIDRKQQELSAGKIHLKKVEGWNIEEEGDNVYLILTLKPEDVIDSWVDVKSIVEQFKNMIR